MGRRVKRTPVQRRSYNHFFTQKGAYFVCSGTSGTNGCGLALTGVQLRSLKSQRCPGPKAQPTEVAVRW